MSFPVLLHRRSARPAVLNINFNTSVTLVLLFKDGLSFNTSVTHILPLLSLLYFSEMVRLTIVTLAAIALPLTTASHRWPSGYNRSVTQLDLPDLTFTFTG